MHDGRRDLGRIRFHATWFLDKTRATSTLPQKSDGGDPLLARQAVLEFNPSEHRGTAPRVRGAPLLGPRGSSDLRPHRRVTSSPQDQPPAQINVQMRVSCISIRAGCTRIRADSPKRCKAPPTGRLSGNRTLPILRLAPTLDRPTRMAVGTVLRARATCRSLPLAAPATGLFPLRGVAAAALPYSALLRTASEAGTSAV